MLSGLLMIKKSPLLRLHVECLRNNKNSKCNENKTKTIQAAILEMKEQKA